MKISNIKVTITEKDMYSIITDVLNDYVDIKGLTISKILIDNNIYVMGNYKHKINIPFEVYFSISGLDNNVLALSIDNVKVKSLKIYGGIIRIVFKAIADKVQKLGISFKDKEVLINFDKLCKVIPMVEFKLKGLEMIPYGLRAELDDFVFISDENSSGKDEENTEDNNDEDNSSVSPEETQPDTGKDYSYKYFRNELKNKISDKYKKFYPYMVLIPDIVALFFRLYKDERVSKESKVNISIALGYLLCPLDILPDSIPLVGKIDDFAVVFYVMQKILCDIPEKVIMDNWEGEDNIIEISRDAITLLQDKFGIKEMKKIIDLVRIAGKRTIKFFVD